MAQTVEPIQYRVEHDNLRRGDGAVFGKGAVITLRSLDHYIDQPSHDPQVPTRTVTVRGEDLIERLLDIGALVELDISGQPIKRQGPSRHKFVPQN